MLLQRINCFNNCNSNNIDFKSSNRRYYSGTYKDSYTKGDIYNCTCLFRDDMDWNKLTKFIADNFRTKNKVNLYSLGCSDGSEGYSLAIKFLELKMKESENYVNIFPIIAVDKDSEMIRIAKSGQINLSVKDLSELDEQIDKNKNVQYFQYVNENELKTTNYVSYIFSTYKVSDKLKKSVKFREGDILETLKHINDKGNTVVMCRNTFPFVNQNYINETVLTLSKKLKSGSLFIIGKFDEHTNIDSLLLKNGFKKTPVENVYRRI